MSWPLFAAWLTWQALGLVGWAWANHLAYTDDPVAYSKPRTVRQWLFFFLAPYLGLVLILGIVITEGLKHKQLRFGLRFR
jgi:hypothetical protein